MQNNFSKLQCITLTGLFGAIIFLLTFTPLGFPQIPLIGSATIIHIPVIIGAILMGPKYGAILGFMFGLSSFIFASTLSMALNAFAFTPLRPVPGTDSGSPWSLLVAFVPRILVGVVVPLAFYGMKKIKVPDVLNMAISAVIGSATNTLLVLHMLYFMFREPWGYARAVAGVELPQITYAFVAGIITGFGIPEAIAAAVIVPAVGVPLLMLSKRLSKGTNDSGTERNA
ncbi:MAG: ECF transporter S component [Defluviitaleaceae bacterium]|nr:ECF transporter S component [Defluviitaleaceae bacterium]